jgi:heme/copper-type cytochrome/quinol oxidase subunit 2
MNIIKKVFVTTSIFATLAFLGAGVSVAFAQGAATNGSAPATTAAQAPITNQTQLIALFCNIISWFIVILLAISVIMILFAAYDYITAQEDTEKTSKARRTLTYAAVGIAVALLAYGFPQIVATVFPGSVSVSAFSCS